jgi:hypothetical protein
VQGDGVEHQADAAAQQWIPGGQCYDHWFGRSTKLGPIL